MRKARRPCIEARLQNTHANKRSAHEHATGGAPMQKIPVELHKRTCKHMWPAGHPRQNVPNNVRRGNAPMKHATAKRPCGGPCCASGHSGTVTTPSHLPRAPRPHHQRLRASERLREMSLATTMIVAIVADDDRSTARNRETWERLWMTTMTMIVQSCAPHNAVESMIRSLLQPKSN